MKIAPSILSADFSNLQRDIELVEKGGADYIHVDVMDGQFVPNITFGPNIVQAIRPITKLPLDVHLMIVDPEKYIPAFAKAGADIITVHVEATPHIHRALQMMKDLGVKSGVVINYSIEVDGGIVPETAQICQKAGADVFVAGSYIYNSEDPVGQINQLKEALK